MILFLRLGWVVGQVGLVSAILIIAFSSLITFVTGLSISASATNSEVGAGGSYFLISRCFGLETGAAIGIPLYCAQALGITFYSVGFAESLQLFFPGLPIQIVAFVTLTLLTGMTFLSSSLALKTQMIIFAVILIGMVSFFLGSPSPDEIVVESTEVVERVGFWAVFAVFFPAVTGIEAGVSMSGDLKNPSKSLPIGTIAAVFVGFSVYVLSAIKLESVASTTTLLQNNLLMPEVASVSLLVFLGLWGATLSSTLGALLGAPRTLQALSKDRALPQFLAKGSSETNEPQRATILTYFVAVGGLFLGDLNAIASILSMFFLTSYGALNLVSALEGIVANPTWRPKIRVPWVVSLAGAIFCCGAMVMIDSGAFIISILAISLVYSVTRYRKIQPRFSDIRSGIWLHLASRSIVRLDSMKKDARNWRPNFLILSGSPRARYYLIELAQSIARNRGFMTIVSILTDSSLSRKKYMEMEQTTKAFLQKRKVSALVRIQLAKTVSIGARNLIENYGFGSVSPNTVVIGDSLKDRNIIEYTEIILNVYSLQKNLMIVKMDPERSFKKGRKTIDIWWRGQHNNASLMLTLACMLQASSAWRNSILDIKSLTDSEEGKKGIYKYLYGLTRSGRIPAKIEVFTKENSNKPYQFISEQSADSDLVFIGMRRPAEGESAESYSKYYKNILKKTEVLKNAVYVLAGEKISFHEIFS